MSVKFIWINANEKCYNEENGIAIAKENCNPQLETVVKRNASSAGLGATQEQLTFEGLTPVAFTSGFPKLLRRTLIVLMR